MPRTSKKSASCFQRLCQLLWLHICWHRLQLIRWMLNHPLIDNKTTLCPIPFLYQLTFQIFSVKLCLPLLSLLLILLLSHSNPSATILSITSLEETFTSSLKPFDFASTSISSNESQSTSKLSLKLLPWLDPPPILLSTSPIWSNLMSSSYFSVSCTTRSTISTTYLWDNSLMSSLTQVSGSSQKYMPWPNKKSRTSKSKK